MFQTEKYFNEMQDMLGHWTTWKCFDPVNHPKFVIFSTVGVILFLNVSLNPMLRKLVLEKVKKLLKIIKSLFVKSESNDPKIKIRPSSLILLIGFLTIMMMPLAIYYIQDSSFNQTIENLTIDLNKRYKKDELFKDDGKLHQRIEGKLTITLLNRHKLEFDGEEIYSADIEYQSESNLPRGEKGFLNKINIHLKNVPLDKLKEKIQQFGNADYDKKFEDWYLHRLEKNTIPNLTLENWFVQNNGVQNTINISPTYNNETTADLLIGINLGKEYFK